MSKFLLLFGAKKSIGWSAVRGSLLTGWSFTRASSGSRFNGSGALEVLTSNAPRFNSNPATLALKGLLIEPQRTNLVVKASPDADGTYWSAANATSAVDATAGAAPDGTSTWVKLTDSALNVNHGVFLISTISYSSGSSYTISCYAKKGSSKILQLSAASSVSSPNGYANFDLNAGTVTATGSGSSASIEAIGNGVYRCTLTFVSTSTTTGAAALILLTNDNATAARAPAYVGSSLYVYVWGVQAEAATSQTSFIPTTTAAVTRAQDQLTFTIPAGVDRLVYSFDDNSTQTVNVSAGSYTVPTNLTRPNILSIRGT